MFASTAAVRPVLADLVPGTRVRELALVFGGASLTGLAAQVSIATPLSPVPFTLQTLAVLVVGASLGSTRGIASLVVYLVAGVAGVPWFAGHSSGWGGSAFGYIIGFLAAAGLVGALARRGADRRVLSTILVMAAGMLVIYAIGTVWLAFDIGVGFGKAVELGVRPFLLTDAIKISVAALALPAAWRFVRQ